MEKKVKKQLDDKVLQRAVSKALKRVEKMVREEPQKIVIEGDGNIADGTASEIQEWLFKRRQDNDNKIIGRISRK